MPVPAQKIENLKAVAGTLREAFQVLQDEMAKPRFDSNAPRAMLLFSHLCKPSRRIMDDVQSAMGSLMKEMPGYVPAPPQDVPVLPDPPAAVTNQDIRRLYAELRTLVAAKLAGAEVLLAAADRAQAI